MAENSLELIPSQDPEGGLVQANSDLLALVRTAQPRDLRKIQAELDLLLDLDPQFAMLAIYRRPVGKDESGRERVAEGLSIRAAEMLVGYWGYYDMKYGFTPVWNDKGQLQGANVWVVFTDLQNASRWEERSFASIRYQTRNKTMATYPEDRFLEVQVRGVMSRRLRDVVRRAVNPALLAWFRRRCEEVATTLITPAQIAKTIAEFEKLGIPQRALEKLLDRPIASGWTAQTRVACVGLYNALRDGEVTVDELLASVQMDRTKSDQVQALQAAMSKRGKKSPSPTKADTPRQVDQPAAVDEFGPRTEQEAAEVAFEQDNPIAEPF